MTDHRSKHDQRARFLSVFSLQGALTANGLVNVSLHCAPPSEDATAARSFGGSPDPTYLCSLSLRRHLWVQRLRVISTGELVLANAGQSQCIYSTRIFRDRGLEEMHFLPSCALKNSETRGQRGLRCTVCRNKAMQVAGARIALALNPFKGHLLEVRSSNYQTKEKAPLPGTRPSAILH